MKQKPKPVPPRLSGLSYANGKPFVSGVKLVAGTKYTITAQPNNVTRSVVFKRDDAVRIDSGIPFEFIFTPSSIGNHTFTATPWSGSNGTGNSGPAIIVTFEVVETIVAEPILTTALVSWSQIADATGYRVLWGTVSRQYSYVQDVGNNLQYRVPDLRRGTTYYFAAKSYNANAVSDLSNEEMRQA